MIALCNTPGDLEIKKLMVRFIALDKPIKKRHPLRLFHGRSNANCRQAALQPSEMRLKTERLASIDWQDLVNTIAENKSSVEYRDLCLGKRQPLAVKKDRRVAVNAIDHVDCVPVNERAFHQSRIASMALPSRPADFTDSAALIDT